MIMLMSCCNVVNSGSFPYFNRNLARDLVGDLVRDLVGGESRGLDR